MLKTENQRSRFVRIATPLLGVALSLCFSQVVSADPTGIAYDVVLDAILLDGSDEGHANDAFITFDGIPELVPNDLVPPFPNLPGNDLIVTEDVIFNLDGSDTITIWIEGQDPGSSFPTPGAPLFANPLDPLEPVFLDIGGLHWGTTEALFLSDIEVILSFSGGVEFPVIPLDIGFTGAGTSIDPLIAQLVLDSPDFTDSIFGAATDLHFTFTVEHIPEPASVVLLGIGALALFGFFYRRRRAS